MSSPPYFDVEIYNGDQTSTTKFPEYSSWLEGYLRPTIENCREYLIQGGKFILNIKNMGKLKMYDDAMRLCKESGLEFVDEEVLHVTRRTGANQTKTQGLSASNEKLMIFRKPFQGSMSSPSEESQTIESPHQLNALCDTSGQPDKSSPLMECCNCPPNN